jgi:hypothetical protein
MAHPPKVFCVCKGRAGISPAPPKARAEEGDAPQLHGERKHNHEAKKHHENAKPPPASQENKKKEENENGGKGDKKQQQKQARTHEAQAQQNGKEGQDTKQKQQTPHPWHHLQNMIVII